MLCVTAVAVEPFDGFAGPLAKRRAARQHAWGRFQPGSWSLVRTVTETLDEQGAATAETIAETRTVVDDVTEGGVTLQVSKSVEVAGKKLEAPPQKVVEPLPGGEAAADLPEDLGTESITIGGRAYACAVERITSTSAGRTIITRSWISDEIPPFVLKRERVTVDATSGQKIEEEFYDVITLGTPHKVLDKTRLAAEVRQIVRTPRGRTVVRAWQSVDVPGGIVGQSSEEFDDQDKLLRRSHLELVDYSVK